MFGPTRAVAFRFIHGFALHVLTHARCANGHQLPITKKARTKIRIEKRRSRRASPSTNRAQLLAGHCFYFAFSGKPLVNSTT